MVAASLSATLNQPFFNQASGKFDIGGQQVIRQQVGLSSPGAAVVGHGNDLAGQPGCVVSLDVEGAVCPPVDTGGHKISDVYLYAELFFHFPGQAAPVGFTTFNLTPGKFPLSGQWGRGFASGDQDFFLLD